tara:strand:+ start:58846 stop:59334 length:489 start_codon:yes stop_codon:yes gene_type:complete
MIRSLDSLSILLVDEHRESRTLLRDMLITTGVMDIREAKSGEETLKMLADKPTDLILMELGADPKSGIGMVKAIRDPKRCKTPKVAITVVTGLSDKRSVLAARDAGVNDFIAKPVSADALHKRLDRLARKPQEFVENKAYFGPDRRRREIDMGIERRDENHN